ncbi:MAG: hypothetical protein FRX48_02289 [Lasallia pustulata]|uniref:Uncharacterized protein n=1 Tax=Lasallia pustulata TaxID=136370 RepID=A0A5M8PWC6_9LECA|nr:MAG: hypothetical protein FRX48_02289 [Lasallia pustulata]
MSSAINIAPGLLDFAAAAVGNGGDPPPTNKPIVLWAQCNKEGSGSESVGNFVVVCWLVSSLAHSAALRLVSSILACRQLARRLSGPLVALWLIGLLLARQLSGSLPACLLARRLSGGKRGGGTL